MQKLTNARSIVASIVGVDPGFARLGFARGVVVELADGRRIVEVASLDVFATRAHVTRDAARKRTKAGKAARKAGETPSAAADALARLNDIHDAIRIELAHAAVCADGAPLWIAGESLSPPRQAAVAMKLAMVWAALMLSAKAAGAGLWHVTPKNLKRAITDDPGAEKEAIITRLISAYPETVDLARHIKPADQNHAFDAFAALVAHARAEHGAE